MDVLVFLHWPEKCFRANEADLRSLRSLLPRRTKVTAVTSERAFLAALPKATHVITWHFRSDWYARAPKLQLVATPAAGRELVALPPPGIQVHFGGFHGTIISEAVLAFVLAWTHGFFQARSLPLWPRAKLANVVDRDLAGSRAVILGFGRIGHAIAARLTSFGVSVRGFTHADCDLLKGKKKGAAASRAALRSALASADWLIAALPSDTGTDDFVDAALLAKLPRKCVFVNVGRGNCVDEAALLSALKRGRLAGAYLDVYRHEPTVLAKKSRKRGGVDLARLEEGVCPWNLIRMPHASAYSPNYLQASFKELKDEGLL